MNGTVTQQLREKINKWDCIKLKSFCIPKKTVAGLMRQPTVRQSFPAIYLTRD
jgi:hypothetical protein